MERDATVSALTKNERLCRVSDVKGRLMSSNLPARNANGSGLDSAALEEARCLFSAEGLRFPPIPPDLAPRVGVLAPWVFGTRALTRSLYGMEWFVQEAESQPVEDYLLFGHAGHGINSWAMHYYLVRDPLMLFLQLGWSGAEMDRDDTTRRIAVAWARAETLIRAVEEAQHTGRWDDTQHLFVVASDFSGSRWARRQTRRSEGDSSAWHRDPHVLQTTWAWVKGL